MIIKNLLLRCTLLVLIITATHVNAAGIDPSLTNPAEQARQQQLESQEQLRQQEILKTLRQKQELKPDVRDEVDALKQAPLKASIEIPDNETPCFTINKIELIGTDNNKFQFALDEVLTQNISSAKRPEAQSILGSCLGVLGINAVMNRVQNAIIAKGYITTRVLAAPQDLKTGVLQLTIIPGHVSAIRFTADSSKHVSMWNASPIGIGAAVGGTAGATTALVVDTNNRQLDRKVKNDIVKKALSDCNNDFKCASAEVVRLTEIACAIYKCSEVDWVQLVQSSIGLVGSVAGTFVGGVETAVGVGLVFAPEPTGITKVAGLTTLAVGTATLGDNSYGIYSNAVNIYQSLGESDAYLPSNGLSWVANYFAPDNQAAQDAAAITSLTLALASGQVSVGTSVMYADSAFAQRVPVGVNGMLDFNAVAPTGAYSWALIPNATPGASMTSRALDNTQRLQVLGSYYDTGGRLINLTSPSVTPYFPPLGGE
jgi:hypothetical protein